MSKTINSTHVVVFGLDAFRDKNAIQIKAMNEIGYFFDIFINDNSENSPRDFKSFYFVNNLFVVNSSFFLRFFQVFLYLLNNSKTLNHAELYVGGRFTIIYSILLKLFRVKTVAVERGDMKHIMQNVLKNKSIFLNLVEYSFKFAFRLADIVWYKEPYMEKLLRQIGVTNMKLVSNCVTLKSESNLNKEINFLWVNRILKERDATWLLQYAQLNHEAVTVLGVKQNQEKLGGMNKELEILVKDASAYSNITLKGYIKPDEYFQKAKFFILISDYVFGNNSLLEAMSYGVVPIVSNTEATSLIVKDGINGIVFNQNYESFASAMKRAKQLTDIEYAQMRDQVYKTISEFYSYNVLQKNLKDIYNTFVN